MNVVLLMCGLLMFQGIVFGEKIELTNAGDYTLTFFDQDREILPLYKEEKIAHDGRARPLSISGNFIVKGHKEESITLPPAGSDIALITTPRKKKWFAVTRRPFGRDTIQERHNRMMSSGKASAGSINIEGDKFVNNFVIVDIDREKALKSGDTIPLKTIWDPVNGIENEKFQADLCGWLSALEKADKVSICKPKLPSEPSAPPVAPSPTSIPLPTTIPTVPETVTSPEPTTEPFTPEPVPTPKVMSAAEAREVELNLTKLAADLAALSTILS